MATNVPLDYCPYDCWAFRHFDYCIHTDPIPADSDTEHRAAIDLIFDRD